ncbi:putative ABC exporter domain-containing protein, partial [Streptococcus gordonii]
YVYLLSIQKDSYRHIPQIAAVFYVLMVVAVYGMVIVQNQGQLAGSGTLFLNTELFYWVPLFGWIKMILVSYIAASWGMLALGIALL